MNNATQIVVYVSKVWIKVDMIVDHLKRLGLDVITICEANKPYAVKVETTLDLGWYVLALIRDAITKFS